MVVELTVVTSAREREVVQSLPASLIDGVRDADDISTDDLWLRSLDQLNEALASAPPGAERILVDGTAFRQRMPQFLVALSALLADWNGREIRLILPPDEDPCHLIRPLADLLRALGQRTKGVRIISCPTCARCHTDLVPLAHRIGKELERIEASLDVAIMGCEVNGPGEARTADVGVAFGKGVALLFRRGKIVKRVKEDEAKTTLLEEVFSLANETVR